MLEQYFSWFKAFHVISVICWMAAMFYLPRLFVYHAKAELGSELDLTLRLMEVRLQRIIMNPAMISTYIFGLIVAYIYGLVALGTWFYIKIIAVLLLTALHGYFSKCRKNFSVGKNQHSHNFYRFMNEVPVILMIVAVVMVIIKPFE